MVGSHDDHFHLWKEVHKDIAHQLAELQKVAHRLGEVGKRMGRLSIQVDGVEVRVAEQEVVGNRLSRLVLWTVGGVLHTLAKVEFLQQLVSSFLSFGGGSDDGFGLPDGTTGPPRGPGPRSSPSPCLSLQSLQSSDLDSPLVATPSCQNCVLTPFLITSGPDPYVSFPMFSLRPCSTVSACFRSGLLN